MNFLLRGIALSIASITIDFIYIMIDNHKYNIDNHKYYKIIYNNIYKLNKDIYIYS